MFAAYNVLLLNVEDRIRPLTGKYYPPYIPVDWCCGQAVMGLAGVRFHNDIEVLGKKII
ncbi:hypothetical protein Acr_17g0009330 [Actinidia rufa]|uniref:Uncharacterized protein n=1 Tax=Actinidia rufa TaxID=165716 RepID=A0A7J0G3K3_9ERIC|nr:hypothetical protein Acr_17g0009330 [Actinidia rufa]